MSVVTKSLHSGNGVYSRGRSAVSTTHTTPPSRATPLDLAHAAAVHIAAAERSAAPRCCGGTSFLPLPSASCSFFSPTTSSVALPHPSPTYPLFSPAATPRRRFKIRQPAPFCRGDVAGRAGTGPVPLSSSPFSSYYSHPPRTLAPCISLLPGSTVARATASPSPPCCGSSSSNSSSRPLSPAVGQDRSCRLIEIAVLGPRVLSSVLDLGIAD